MKSIVIYDSCTGNTKKVAEVIAKTLGCELAKIDEVGKYKIEEYDLVVVGTPVHAAMSSKKIKKFLKEKRIKNSYACFCTYGLYILGILLAKNCLNYMKKEINVKYLGEFKCPGFYPALRMHKTRPNQTDLTNAEKFAQVLK